VKNIKVLPKKVYELIAAGEVVERPASVVKELVENAVDAQASQITVEIKNGGISYIRVSDNGSGIPADEVRTAFLSHATSKIDNDTDLYSIATLGFRGEALASIASVSKVEILTRTSFEDTGVLFKTEAGEETGFQAAGCPLGTTMIVRDLFYNTPARMKFLKKDVYEANAVASTVEKLALSHSEIAFKFIRDGKITLQTPGDGKVESVVYAVFGSEFYAGMIRIAYTLGDISVSGFVSSPACARMNRNIQLFFLNGRYIKNQTAVSALAAASKGYLVPGKYPACVIYIEIPHGKVDVNVHPAKTEVRFENEKELFHAVYYGVKTTNASYAQSFTAAAGGGAPQHERYEITCGETARHVNMQPCGGADDETAPTREETKNQHVAREEPQAAIYNGLPEKSVSGQVSFRDIGLPGVSGAPGQDSSAKEQAHQQQTGTAGEQEAGQDIRVLGETFGTYFIAEAGDSIYLIDKHAAHERMIYDTIKASSENTPSQLLLIPVCVNLTKEEHAAVTENTAVLEKAGYLVEDFGPGTVIVRQAPMPVDIADISDMIVETAGYLADNRHDALPRKLDWLYQSVACRAAVKAGSFTSDIEREQFVRDLFTLTGVRNCPHGRPVMVRIDKHEIEKRFDRT